MIERINLLPKRQRVRALAATEMRWFLIALAFAVSVLLALGTREHLRRGRLDRQRQEITATRDRILAEQRNLAAAVGRVKSLAGEKAVLQGRLDALAALQQGRRSWSELLVRISRFMPEGVWLTNLGSSIEDQGGGQSLLGLRFQGKAFSHERVAELLAALERDAEFQDVELNSTSKGTYLERDIVDFSIFCRVRARDDGRTAR